jgi:hypothetical protein
MSASPTTKALADPVRAGYCQTGHLLILDLVVWRKEEKEKRMGQQRGKKRERWPGQHVMGLAGLNPQDGLPSVGTADFLIGR